MKDADTIYVMGEGLVLEAGTHEDLYSQGGAYTRLVEAQKLRETANPIDQEDSETTEKAAQKTISLERKYTNHSLASDILEQRRLHANHGEDGDYSLFYLFRRMAPIARSQWPNYTVGALFACSKCYKLVLPMTIAEYHRHTSDWNGISSFRRRFR